MGNISAKKKPSITDDEKFNYLCEIRKDNDSVLSFPYDKRTCTFGQEYIYFNIPKQKIEPFPHKFEFIFRDQTFFGKEFDHYTTHNLKIKYDRCELSIYKNKPSIVTLDNIRYQEYQMISDQHGTFIFRIPHSKKYKTYSIVYIRNG